MRNACRFAGSVAQAHRCTLFIQHRSARNRFRFDRSARYRRSFIIRPDQISTIQPALLELLYENQTSAPLPPADHISPTCRATLAAALKRYSRLDGIRWTFPAKEPAAFCGADRAHHPRAYPLTQGLTVPGQTGAAAKRIGERLPCIVVYSMKQAAVENPAETPIRLVL